MTVSRMRQLPDGPAYTYEAITPTDSTATDDDPDVQIYRGFYVGDTSGGSAVVLIRMDGTEVSLTGVNQGVTYNFVFKRIKSTGTTAASIVGLV